MEPLKELAMFTYYWAPILCGNADCSTYHKNWSLIRLLEGKGRQPDCPDFFIENIEKYCNEKHSRILISGSADTGILSVIHNAIKKMNHVPEITIIDKCKTPIQQNKLYAEYLNLDVKYVVGDILTANLSHFDVIVAHSFLNFFPDEYLDRLFRQWYEFLSPNGVILLNNKSVDNQLDNVARTVDVDLIADRVVEIKNEVQKLRLPAEIVDSISDFWVGGRIRNLITSERLNELVSRNNFSIVDHQFYKSGKKEAPTSLILKEHSRSQNLMVLRKVI